jgi:hypothetical protein
VALRPLAKELGVHWSECLLCFVAFETCKQPGLNFIGSDRLQLVLDRCGVTSAVENDPEFLLRTCSPNRELDLRGLVLFSSAKRSTAQKFEQRLNCAHHSDLVRFCVLVAIVLQFILDVIVVNYSELPEAARLRPLEVTLVALLASEALCNLVLQRKVRHLFWFDCCEWFDVCMAVGSVVALGWPRSRYKVIEALRIFRVVKRVGPLRRSVTVILMSALSAWGGLALLVLSWLAYALLGLALFSRPTSTGAEQTADDDVAIVACSAAFGDYPAALYTLFLVLADAHWSELARACDQQRSFASAFFVTFLLVALCFSVNVLRLALSPFIEPSSVHLSTDLSEEPPVSADSMRAEESNAGSSQRSRENEFYPRQQLATMEHRLSVMEMMLSDVQRSLLLLVEQSRASAGLHSERPPGDAVPSQAQPPLRSPTPAQTVPVPVEHQPGERRAASAPPDERRAHYLPTHNDNTLAGLWGPPRAVIRQADADNLKQHWSESPLYRGANGGDGNVHRYMPSRQSPVPPLALQSDGSRGRSGSPHPYVAATRDAQPVPSVISLSPSTPPGASPRFRTAVQRRLVGSPGYFERQPPPAHPPDGQVTRPWMRTASQDRSPHSAVV